jgi:hypothetical protein
MIDEIMTALITTVGIVLFLGLVFVAFVLWTARESLVKLVQAIGGAWKKAKADDYTRDEILYNIRYFETNNKPRLAAHWQRELGQRYPEDPSNE